MVFIVKVKGKGVRRERNFLGDFGRTTKRFTKRSDAEALARELRRGGNTARVVKIGSGRKKMMMKKQLTPMQRLMS